MVDGDQDERVGLLQTLAGNDVGRHVRNSQGTSASGTVLGISRRGEFNADVGQLAVVGRAVGVDVHQIQGVGVQVVASLLRDGRSAVPRLDQGEVVNRHVRQTLGVLVVDRDLGQGIGGGSRVERHTSGSRDRRGRRVVSPFSLVGRVLQSKEQSLDGVREVDVNAGRVAGGINRLRVVGLDLLNQQVTGSLAHQLTLIVGHQGVLGPYLDVGQGNVGVRQIGRRGIGRHTTRASTASDGSNVVNDQQIRPVAEVEAQLHFVVRQGGRRQGNTRVAGVAVRQRQHQRGGRDDQTVVGSAHSVRVVVQQRDVTDHVVVADALGRGDREG